jgi:hypothetical protein
MAVEDYLEPEVAVAVAVTAAVASPKARRVMRQGAVYGLAGILKAGDALGTFSRGLARGVQSAAESAQAATEPAESTGDTIIVPGQASAEVPATHRSRPSRAKAQQGEEAGE